MAEVFFPLGGGVTVRAHPTADGGFDYYAVNPDGTLGARYDAPPPGAAVELALTIPATSGTGTAEAPWVPFLFHLIAIKLPDLAAWGLLFVLGLMALGLLRALSRALRRR